MQERTSYCVHNFFFNVSHRDQHSKDAQISHKELLTKKETKLQELDSKIEDMQRENTALLQKLKKVIFIALFF